MQGMVTFHELSESLCSLQQVLNINMNNELVLLAQLLGFYVP